MQLSSNFVSFFEKLADMLDRILARLPNYAEHLERLRRRASFQDRSRIFEALSYVYSDIIQFCQSACKIFMTKTGGQYLPPLLRRSRDLTLRGQRYKTHLQRCARSLLDTIRCAFF